MKEYTILSACAVIVTILVDMCMPVKILRRKEFYFFLAVILSFKLLLNGYLTGANIVNYRDTFYLGLRIGSIPLEDFLFGFSMVTLTIIFWEFFKTREKIR